MDERDIFNYAKKEKYRQKTTLSLIASENKTYPEVLKLAKYPLSNKYSEGYPGKRFYSGCQNIDDIENFAIEQAKKAFSCKFANVQCYSGSIANFAIYKAFLNYGDTILSMDMSSGGHLTHSSKVSFVSSLYKVETYSVDPITSKIDYVSLRDIALRVKPKLIIAGASSYPFKVDFSKFRDICDEVGAYLFADICHLSAFIISKEHSSCFPYAHVAMCTMHKQLRGTRGAIILWNDEKFSLNINKSVFPGLQGGMNPSSIAMNALALYKSNTLEFKNYVERILNNSKFLCERFIFNGVEVIGRGTETHMILLDVKKSFGLNGQEASDLLESAGIMVNKNLIPFDKESPSFGSGIRIGTLSLSILDITKNECFWIADVICRILILKNKKEINNIRTSIRKWLLSKNEK